MSREPIQGSPAPILERLGSLSRRFGEHDGAHTVLGSDRSLAVVTGFGPTNAPTAGTLSVMLGIVELQHQLQAPTTVVISELGAWNSRNVPWHLLTEVRDQMTAFLRAIGFDETKGEIRSHLDQRNLVRSGRIARFLGRQDFLDHHEDLLELYNDHGLLGSEVGVTVDSLYTIADVLGPLDDGATDVLVVSGIEEAYFTQLARLVLERQSVAGDLGLGWQANLGALYFRVLEGLQGYPKMSKSIPASSIHLGMSTDEIARKIRAEDPGDQGALLSSIELASGWAPDEVDAARMALSDRAADPLTWRQVKERFIDSFLAYRTIWQECAR